MLEKATFIATINAGFTLQNMVFALKASFSIKITQTHLSEREREKSITTKSRCLLIHNNLKALEEKIHEIH